MKIYNNSDNTTIAIVGCVHGDEIFGIPVIAYFKKHAKKYPMLKLILAHTKAIEAKKRYIEEDLNRCFGYDKTDICEKKLAKKIYDEIKNMEYVIDIHTTSSDLRMTPIITQRNKKTNELISHTRSREVMYVIPSLGLHSLIAQVEGGVSLEFNEEYGKTKCALQDVIDVVDGIIEKRAQNKLLRKIFQMDSILARDTVILDNDKNFEYSASLQCYPFLLHERSYILYRGYGASGFDREVI